MGQVHFLVLSWVLVLISSSRMGLKLRKNLAWIRLRFSFSHLFLREKFLYLVNFQKDLHSTIFCVSGKLFYETTEIKLYICFTKYVLIKLHRCLCGFYKVHHHQIFGEKLEVFLGPILSDLNFDAHKLEKF